MPLIIAAVPASKADNRPRPDMDALRGMEDDATERIYAALQKWARAIFRDVTGDRVALLMTRLDDPDIVRPLRDALIAVLQDVAESGADFGREQIEQAVYGIKRTATVDPGAVDWTAANADAARWATEYGYLLVNGITDTTRARIANEIRYFVDNSLTINQLRDRLMEGSLFNRTRAKAIAVTEVTRAYAEGNTAAWQASGLVEGREWVTANDEMVCPICGPLHGTIAKMGEAFRGLYRNPPAHVNCRCVVLPVVMTDTEEFGGMWRFPQAPKDEWSGIRPVVQTAARSAREARERVLSTASDLEEEYARIVQEYEATTSNLADIMKYRETLKDGDLRLLSEAADFRPATNKLIELNNKMRSYELKIVERQRAALYVDNPLQITIDDKSGRSAKARDVLRLIPNTNRVSGKTVKVLGTRGRAYQQNGNIYMAAGDEARVFAHELGHVLEEYDNEMLRRSLNFVRSRTYGEEPQSLAKITGRNYRSNEMTRRDQFINPYIGKDYGNAASEVVSMGLEYFYAEPGRLAREDPDMFEFIFNTLRGGHG